MQVTVIENNRNINSNSKKHTVLPLTCLLQLFSLNFNDKVTKVQSERSSLLKKALVVTTLGLVTLYTSYYKVRYVFSELNVSVRLTDTIQSVFNYCQIIVDLYFVHKYGRDIALQYHTQYENIDKILDIVHDSNVKNRVVKLMGIMIFICLMSSTCDFIAWSMSYGYMIPVVFSIAYLFFLIKILTTLDLSYHVINIECRLRVLGDLMQGYHNNAEKLAIPYPKNSIIDDIINNENWFYSDGCSRVLQQQTFHPLKRLGCEANHETKWLTRCYLLLTEQCTFINKMYGIRILLTSTSLLIDMIRFLNIAVRVAIGSQLTTYSAGYFPAVTSLFRTLACAAVLINVVVQCERVYRQRDRILCIIIHVLINKNPSAELRSAAGELRGLVESRPICFNMANFFTLNYPFLVSTASVVVTYTIILLQSED